jgi:hypothetical protein
VFLFDRKISAAKNLIEQSRLVERIIEKAVDALGDQGRRVSIAMFFAGALCTVTMDRKSDLQNWLTSVG